MNIKFINKYIIFFTLFLFIGMILFYFMYDSSNSIQRGMIHAQLDSSGIELITGLHLSYGEMPYYIGNKDYKIFVPKYTEKFFIKILKFHPGLSEYSFDTINKHAY